MNANAPTILIISPGGLMPVRGGGTAHTWGIIDYLRSVGYRVELVTANHGELNPRVESQVDKLWVQETSPKESQEEHTAAVRMGGYFRFSKKVVRRAWKSLKKNQPPNSQPSIFDQSRRPGIEMLAGAAAYQSRPLAAIAIFPWMARALDRMPPGTLRIVNTIDVQHIRKNIAEEAGGDLSHVHCSREEEIRELSRADALLAIQSEEQRELSEMCPDLDVIVVGHGHKMAEFKPSPKQSRDVLYIGNLYDPNVLGLQQFLEKTWKKIRQNAPGVQLIVCGRVCEAFDSVPEGVQLKGIVPDLEEYYERAAVVINPVTYGTGLKIKSVEALAHGRCLVCTKSGTLGLGDPEQIPLLMAEHGQPFAAHVVRALVDTQYRAEIERATYTYAKSRYSPPVVYRDLANLLSKHGGISPPQIPADSLSAM